MRIDIKTFTRITGFNPVTEEERGWAWDDIYRWDWNVRSGYRPEDVWEDFKPYASSQEEALDMAKQVWDALRSEGEE